MHDNYVVIMAGGVGSRLWPFSRKNYPKQFQDVLGIGKTLIQQTVDRFEGICPKENIYIATNASYESIVKEQLPFISDDALLIEPVMRNTAPCIAYAAHKIGSKNPNASLIITPSDHMIFDDEKFYQDISTVLAATKNNRILATLGIKPTHPNTGYGYIQVLENEKIEQLNKVKVFTEKPDLDTARAFIETGEFVWNAGIFITKTDVILEEFAAYLPQISEPFTEIVENFYTKNEYSSVQRAFYQCTNVSIDYGIMEKSRKVYVLKANFGWSDLGTWKTVYEASIQNKENNVISGNILAYDTQGCIIKASSDKLVVAKELKNYIVVEQDSVLMICPIAEEQKVKKFITDAKEKFNKNFS